MAKLNLPSTFTSFPNGKAPPHYAPHAQRSLDLRSSPQGAPSQRSLELRTSPQGAPSQRTLELRTSPQGAPSQRTLELRTTPQGAPSQRTLELKTTPQGPPSQRTLELKKTPQGAPSQRTLELKKTVAATGDSDPWGNYYFALEITADGKKVEVAHFMECSGMKSGSTPYAIHEGGNNWNTWLRPDQNKWDNLVFKAGVSKSNFFMFWRNEFIQGRYEKRTKYSGSVSLMNNHGEVLRRYHFTNAWPVSYEGPSGASSGSDIAMETLELAHEGLYIEQDGTPAARKAVDLG